MPQHEQITDWLASLEFVDGERIGFYGLSYGGKTAMRVPALVDRYCLSICSGDFNEWIRKCTSVRDPFSYMGTHEYEMFEFDLGHTFNYAEMAYLIAPRPFMVERGHRDGVGIDEWVAYEYAKVRMLYADLKIPERTEIEYFDGPHKIHAVGHVRFLASAFELADAARMTRLAASRSGARRQRAPLRIAANQQETFAIVPSSDRRESGFELAFPDDQRLPTFAAQQPFHRRVAGNVAIELRLPELHARRGHRSSLRTAMSMPKTAVHEHDFLQSGKHEIGIARHLAALQAIANAERRDDLPNDAFRRSVARTDGPHDGATLGGGEDVGHDDATYDDGAMRRSARSTCRAITSASGGGTALPI